MPRETVSPWEMTSPVTYKFPPTDVNSDGHRKVCIQRARTGWSLCNLGTSMVAVNQTVVDGETRLKPGDVIRLSLAGPELVFSIVTDRGCLPTVQMESIDRAFVDPAFDEGDSAEAAASAEDAEETVAEHSRRFPLWYVVAAVDAAALLLLVAWVVFRPHSAATVSWQPIPEQSVDEGRPWVLNAADYVALSDSQACAFRPVGTLPVGMTLNEKTGQLTWTPSESQGPGSFPVQIEVRGGPPSNAGAVSSFAIQVREVNAPPRMQSIPDTTFALGTKEALEIQVTATDDDLPRQPD